ncbi:MAG: PAS domain S-box protein [Thermoanaerobaculaceae bacterium]
MAESTLRDDRPEERVPGVDVVLDALPCPAFLCTPEWRLVAANGAAVSLVGQSCERLAGGSMLEILPDCTPERATAAGGSWLPLRVLGADGHELPCLARFQPLSPGGDVLALVVCENGGQELCRRVTETYYQRLFAQASVGLATLDPATGHILQCNRRLAEILGFEEGELVGRRLTQLLHGDDRPASDALFTGLVQGRRGSYDLECLANRKDGTVACLRLVVSTVLDSDEKPMCVLADAYDLTVQRHEEKRLRAAEDRFRLLFEHNVAGLVRFTVDGRVLECNEAFARMLGFGYPAQVLEHHIGELFPTPAHRDAFMAELGELVRLRNHETELRRKDGRALWGLVNATLTHDAEGTLTVVEGSIVDITDRKHADRLLRVQHDLARDLAAASSLEDALPVCLRAALEASGLDSGGIYLATDDGGLDLAFSGGVSPTFVQEVRRVAPGSPRIRSLSAREALFLSIADVDEASRADWEKEGLRSAAALPICHEGTLVGCFNLASHTLDEVPRAARPVLETITAEVANAILRIRAESAVRLREAELANLFNSLRDLVFVADTEGTLLDVNRSACAHLGYTREELVGRHVSILHPADSSEIVDQTVAGVALGRVSSFQLPLVAGDGRCLPVEVTTSRGTWGEKAVLFGVARDISERLRDEQRITELLKREAVGRLAAGVAHEFNNVLQAMVGHAALLRLRAGDRLASERLAADLELQIRRGALVARQLLEFSLPGSADRRALDLNEVLRRALDTLRQLLRENISIEVALDARPLVVEADRSLLELVIWNLVLNAAEAMPGPGEMVVTSGGDGDAWVWFSVADSGLGIPDDLKDRIFEPLFTTKRASESSGLGLSVVADIVARHAGRIEVQSELGLGARFAVTLPASALPAPPAPPAVDPEVPPAARRVLLVEDDDQARASLQRLLGVLGCDVVHAASAEEALEVGGSYDLLVTDLLLPGLAGNELAKVLLARHPGLRVLLVSGYGLSPELHREAGALGFRILPKPFGIDTLAREIALAFRTVPSSRGWGGQ